MKHFFLSLIFIGLFISKTAMAQHNFRSGFIINLQNDTIPGQLDYRTNLKNYASCLFKNDGMAQKYLPGQIKGYGFWEDKFYASNIIVGYFVETLVDGKLSLYKHQSGYLLKKGEEIFPLKARDIEIRSEGRTSLLEDQKWRRVMAYLISDCLPRPNETVAKMSLHEKSLIHWVSRYNECQGETPIIPKTNKKWAEIQWGVIAGVTSHRLELKCCYSTFPEIPYFAPDRYVTVSPAWGILFTISSPRLSERLHLQGELQLSQSQFNHVHTVTRPSTVEHHRSNIQIKMASFPVSLKYLVPWANWPSLFKADFSMTII